MNERASCGVELRFDAADAPTHITADELRLKQVLLNLIGNAVKFTPEGGTVTVRAWTGGPEVIITVTDTGIGIAEADRSRIFDSFQQGTRSASSSEGTGLGLTLTRRIVELHGGRMWLESEVGLGSTFGLALPQPVQRGAPDPGWHEAAVEDARRASRRHRGRPELRRAGRRAPRAPPACGRSTSARARRGWRRSGPCAPPPSSWTSTCRAWTAGTSSA